MMWILAWLVTIVLLGMTGILLLNLATFPRLSGKPNQAGILSPGSRPEISVLVPARNEASHLPDLIASLLSQEGASFELLILDDQSTDGTASVARAAAVGDSRVQVLEGLPLPPGWGEKNWACHQLALQARGEFMVFTDADVRWQPGALLAVRDTAGRLAADLLTVWPTQITITWGERLTVPLMALAVLGYLPVLAVHDLPYPLLAAANGQCLCFRREAYEKAGGHLAVRGSVLDDMNLARKIKSARLRLRMADGAGWITCRMYTGWPQVRDGYAKNILAGHGGRMILLLLSALFHWMVFLGPWVWLVLGVFSPAWRGPVPGAWPVWPLALVVQGILVRAISAAFSGQRPADALFMPVSVLLMTGISLQAVVLEWRGGATWKGRRLASGRT